MKKKVVVQGNCYKFSQNARLKEALLATGERELCEASRRDRVWEIGYRADEAERYREFWGGEFTGEVFDEDEGEVEDGGDGEEYGEVEEEDIEATEGEGVGGGVVSGEIVKT